MAAAAADTRIVLLGKTGSGKSSLANTIIGVKDLFKACHASTSGTVLCQPETKVVNGRSVQLIDTPGLYDTAPDAPDFNAEILNCMIECAPGVHAFLLVLKAERFTKQELSVTEAFTQNFSEEALRYTTVVFTQGDQLEEGIGIRDWVRDNVVLENFVQKCGGRCHVFDNKYWNNIQDPYRNNQHQVRELFNTIDQTVEMNSGRCYTNENLQQVQAKLRQEKETIKATPEYADMSEQEVEKKAKENTFEFLWPPMLDLVEANALELRANAPELRANAPELRANAPELRARVLVAAIGLLIGGLHLRLPELKDLQRLKDV